jgi:hypothetical protein
LNGSRSAHFTFPTWCGNDGASESLGIGTTLGRGAQGKMTARRFVGDLKKKHQKESNTKPEEKK